MKKVEEYMESLPDDRRVICETIRELILENVPGIEEKFSFKIPFYHYFGMFMYLNQTADGTDVGFCRGKDLVNAFPQLQLKQRAMVATLCIREKKDITRLELRQLIIAAAAWNKEAKQLKLPMVNTGKKKRKDMTKEH